MATDQQERIRLERLGRRLQWATIAWNSIEVFVTIGLGIAAGSLALIAFGLDSLVEVFASLVVIWHMNPGADGHQAHRDRKAMRLVAVAFGVLAAYLLVAGVRQLASQDQPDASPIGIAYLGMTAVVMFSLARGKRRVGQALDSEPFGAEASMTFLDGCLATSILTALALNLAFGWWWADPLAALLIGAVAAREAPAQVSSIPRCRAAGELTAGLRSSVSVPMRRLGVSTSRGRFIVSHDLALDDAPDAYRRFDAREDGWTKVLLHPAARALRPAGEPPP